MSFNFGASSGAAPSRERRAVPDLLRRGWRETTFVTRLA